MHALLYFLFEFQPIAKHPRVERRGRMLVKSKINYPQDRFACETGGKTLHCVA
jgi:hypothetical protein